jgi:putative DNA primase/helicase
MSDALRIIDALGGNRDNGMCKCPAHDDSTASLHVSERNGKVLVKCHAGCPQGAVISTLRGRNLWPTKKNSSRPAPKADVQTADEDEREKISTASKILRATAGMIGTRFDEDRGDPSSLAPYLKSRGINQVPDSARFLTRNNARKLSQEIQGFKPYPAMVFEIYGPGGFQGVHLTFLQRTADGNLNGRDGKSVRRIYGKSKGGFVVLREADPDRPLLIAEGIEKALAASELTDLPAICGLNANNLAEIEPPPCVEVIVVGDNDKVGRKAANKAAEALARHGRRVRVAFPPDRYKDWDEACLKEPDHDELRRLIMEADMVERSAEVVRALTMGEVMALKLKPREFLMEPWLTTSSLVMTHAQRGTAKTRLMMSVAHAVATGSPLLNWKPRRPARVVYFDGELPATLIQQRLKLLQPETDNLRIVSRDILLHSTGITLPDLATEEGRDFFDQIIVREKAELIIFDSLSTLVRSGVENDAESWAPIQDWAMEHRFRGRSIIFVHHQGKNGSPRGSSKREDVLDTVIAMRGRSDLSNDNDEVFELQFTKAREFFGADKRPLLLRHSTANGIADWSYEVKRNENEDLIIKLHNEGLSQREIAKKINCHQSHVSRVLTKYESAQARAV